ncbi:hypothetical protein C0991_004424 [Blastosporella zonata]|nr:hypothetical protein C0991_004424 [Blastosporella zonata]
MDSGPSNARPSKVSKTGSGQPSTKQAKPLVDISGAHPTGQRKIMGVALSVVVMTQRSFGHRPKLRWPFVGRTLTVADRINTVAGPSKTTLAVLPTLGTEDNEEEVLGVGILGEPKLEERDDSVAAAPEGSQGPGESESAKSVWRPTDKPATKFERLTRRVGDLQEMEASMGDYTDA